jgi:hypothetical protein
MGIRKTFGLAVLAVSLICGGIADAAVILSDDFADADRSGSNGTIGAWDIVNGISPPSTTLTFFDGDSPTQLGFFNNSLNPGTFDVNNNMTVGGWDTTIDLVVGAADINLTSLVLDMKLTNGSGAVQTTGSKSGQMLVAFFDAESGSVGSADLGGNVGYPSVSYQRTLDLAGITLSAGQAYTMVISARGEGCGHHKALDAIELNGDLAVSVPEPASLTLVGLSVIGLVGFSRRRR